MEFLQPRTLADALALRAEHPGALLIAGGTDLMVQINFDRARPETVIDLGHVAEIHDWTRDGDVIRLGAAVPYSRITAELADVLPGLAIASRTVGSPQIRARGSVGGNLGTSSPAGDALPPLIACGASVELQSVNGTRTLSVEDFITGPKRNALAPDEIITAALVPVARGPQQFSKIGTRNAMVIAVASLAIALDVDARSVTTCIGSAGPRPLRAPEAEDFINRIWRERAHIDDGVAARFGELAGAAASPIDDVRGTAAYRRHAVAVMARRTLKWTWADVERSAA